MYFVCASRAVLYSYSFLFHDLCVPVIVKATNGPRYVVGCRRQIDKSKLKSGTRVALDMTTLTIMRLRLSTFCDMLYSHDIKFM